MITTITNGTLFSGGFDGMAEGAKRAGIETLWNCEIDEWCRTNLKKRYPKAKQYTDVRTDIPEEKTTIVSITSECQDISITKADAIGIFGSRSILIFDGVEICAKRRPDYIIFENSSALTQRGLEYLLCKLAAIGYHAEWQVLSLRSVGVQQNRKRIYLIAYAHEAGLQGVSTTQIFSKRILQEQFNRVYPGWRTRRDIPQPRTLQKANEYPDYKQEIMALGNMCHPIMCHYLFECIKNHITLRNEQAGR